MYKKNTIQGYCYGIRVISKYNLAMKLSFILLLASCLQVSAFSYAQNISLQKKRASLEEILKDIKHQSGYHVFYDVGMIRKAHPITVDLRNVTLDEALAHSLAGQGLGYKIVDKNIIITLSQHEPALKVDNRVPQELVVTGKVTGSEGNPLEGVTVRIKDTPTAVTTDSQGEYRIVLSKKQETLVFTLIGYLTEEQSVVGGSSLNVVLTESVSEIGEVVVTALGISRDKKSLSYAAQSKDAEDLSQARTANLVDGLSGKIAGLTVTNSGAGVGASSKVLLRGNRSISGSSQPLYVVDGITLNGDIANLSPDDIESISVLKGANAAALYGSRANNGAIIITTKSGKGAPEGVSTNLGFNFMGNTPIILTKFQNEYGQGANGIYSENAVTSWGPRFDGSPVKHWSNDPNFVAERLKGVDTYPYVAQPNNIKDFFQMGQSLATNLSVNINSGSSNTFFSYTHTDASGIVAGNDLQGHNLSIRTTSSLSDRLKLDSRLNYIRQDFDNVLFTGESFNNPMRYLYQIPRNIRTADIKHYQFVNSAGQTRQHFYSPGFNGAGNPYWTQNNVLNPRLEERLLGMLSLNYQITDDLSILGRSALDRVNGVSETRLANDTYVTANNGSYTRNNSNSFEWNTDLLLNYHKDLSRDFTVDLNIGANHRVFKSDALGASGVNFQIENLFALGNTQDPRPIDTYYRHKEVQSVYAFGDLSYRNAIFLNLTGRNDWSSTLPANNRSYFYPSVGLTAVVSELAELPDFINYLKLRGSYAEVGNDTDPYMLSRLAAITRGTISLSPTLPNADLKPESTRSNEIGIDLSLFNNRIQFDFTYYKTNTFDQLFASPVPVGSGVASVFQNGADVQNTGFEFSLGGTVLSRSEFSWDINVNFAKNRSKILEIAEGFDVLNQADDYIRTYKLIKGEPFGAVYSRGYVRDDAGRVIVDANGLPKITTGKDVLVANYNPDWLSGISNTFQYKDFTLSTLIDIRQGGSLISFTEAIESGIGVLDYTAQGRDGSLIFGQNTFEHLTVVTESGEPNTIQVSSEDLWNHLGGVGAPSGEAFVRDASNIRFRELIFGYNLPQRVLAKTFLSSARVSVVGRNLFFISNKAKYVDPEIMTDISNGSEGREALSLPTTRSFGVSLNFGF